MMNKQTLQSLNDLIEQQKRKEKKKDYFFHLDRLRKTNDLIR